MSISKLQFHYSNFKHKIFYSLFKHIMILIVHIICKDYKRTMLPVWPPCSLDLGLVCIGFEFRSVYCLDPTRGLKKLKNAAISLFG